MSQPKPQRQPKPRPKSAILILLSLIALLPACSKPPADSAIRDAITRLESAVENKDFKAVLNELDSDFVYQSSERGIPRLLIGKTLQATLGRYQSISLVISNLDIENDALRDDLAHARFNVLATAGQGGLLPSDGQLYRVESQWLLDGEWKLLSLNSRRALEQ